MYNWIGKLLFSVWLSSSHMTCGKPLGSEGYKQVATALLVAGKRDGTFEKKFIPGLLTLKWPNSKSHKASWEIPMSWAAVLVRATFVSEFS